MFHHRFANATRVLLCTSNWLKLENMKMNQMIPAYLNVMIRRLRAGLDYGEKVYQSII